MKTNYVAQCAEARPPVDAFVRMIMEGSREVAGTDDRRVVAMAGRAMLTHSEVFEFGEFPHSILQTEAERAGQIMHSGLLKTPFQNCIYYYTVTALGLPQWAFMLDDWERERVREATIDDVRRFCTLSHRVDYEGGGSAYFVADFSKAKPDEIETMRRHANRDVSLKHVWCLEGMCAFKPTEDGMYQSNVFMTAFPDSDHSARLNSIAAGSMADAVAGLSLILSTRGVETRVEPVPTRLNAKRARSGKSPLPRVTLVDVRGYARAAANTQRGGTHASPVAHLRRGHVRHLPTGRQTWVRDALVNCFSVNDLANRDHYEIEHE